MNKRQLYICPAQPRFAGDLTGCGHIFESEPDSEELVDCPECGIWFEAEGSEVREDK